MGTNGSEELAHFCALPKPEHGLRESFLDGVDYPPKEEINPE
jgi:hypothetical protein